MTYCQSIIMILIIIWVRCTFYPAELELQDTTETTPLLPIWIDSPRSRRTVRCVLTFTITVTIPTSISQIFLSWVVIFYLHQPMVCLSHSSYARACTSNKCFILRTVRQEVLWPIWGKCQTLWSFPLLNVNLCFLLGFTPVDREWLSAAHFLLRHTWRFQLPYHKLSVPE